MKKNQKLFLGFVVLVMAAIFTIIGCTLENDDNSKNGNNSNETTVDSRLWALSGRWWSNYDRTPPTFDFTKNTVSITRNFITDAPISIYTKNGGVYASDNNRLLFTYIQATPDYFVEKAKERYGDNYLDLLDDDTIEMWYIKRAEIGAAMHFTFPTSSYYHFDYFLSDPW